jgi:glycosyltransferase involved in cell wall biosynthesis
MKPILYVVIPCFNEQEVLPKTSIIFEEKVIQLQYENKVSEFSRILFVDDGSKDGTWEIIQKLSEEKEIFEGISLSRNRGHQNALLAGLMVAGKYADITISIDCDGQDDINAMDLMVDAYTDGCDVVYGVRSDRQSDSFFKRFTAEGFYHIMNCMGAQVVFNHADYRLLSKRVLTELEKYKEVNIFLRGMIPLVGFKSTCVYYERKERIAGKSHYPLKKMLALAIDGITSLSVKPIRIITGLGLFVSLIGMIGIIWAIGGVIRGKTIAGWGSLICIVCFMSGIQLLCSGVIGEYVGKIYLETKGRPKYIIEKSTVKIEDEN